MGVDYSSGRYVAYGSSSSAPRIGWLEDGFVSSDTGTWKFRIDGNEVYGLGGDLAGFIENGIASSKSGQFLFRLERD